MKKVTQLDTHTYKLDVHTITDKGLEARSIFHEGEELLGEFDLTSRENLIMKGYSKRFIESGESLDNGGLEFTSSAIVKLVRGSKVVNENKLEKQDGFVVEQLLEVVEKYLTSVNVGDMRTKDTSMAITKIQEALMWLNKRHEDRKKREVLNTYNK